MTDNPYEHYRRQKEEAAAQIVRMVEEAYEERQRDYLHGEFQMVRPIVDQEAEQLVAQYRRAEAMMQVWEPKKSTKEKKKPAKNHVWRKQQIRGRASRNKGR